MRWTVLRLVGLIGFCGLLVGCGSRSATIADAPDARAGEPTGDEACNALDDDADGNVDEDFRDVEGRYVDVAHCGACGRECTAASDRELTTECLVVDGVPTCGASACAAGFGVSRAGRCVPAFEKLCLPCANDGDCGDLIGGRCAFIGSEGRCSVACSLGCPEGYRCGTDGVCAPAGGSCSCAVGDSFDLACALRDPDGEVCAGAAQCRDGELSECSVPLEVCDEIDNDCDGVVDEGFQDERGAYVLNPAHCGRCGVDCTMDPGTTQPLTCGGDPFSPSCVLRCPDREDGLDPGDQVDADRDIATGCECTVSALDDSAGPLLSAGNDLDSNCDGADGVVLESFYVAVDGDDGGPGSPTLPLRTISEGLARAAASLGTDDPRPNVFVASGTYSELLDMPDGVLLHGGYRRDFLSLNPAGFRVEIRAPADATAPGGAAFLAVNVGATETEVSGVSFIGRDAVLPGAPAFAAVVEEPGPALTIQNVVFLSGVPGAGVDGASGVSGTAPAVVAQFGDAPRAALENPANQCISGPANQVRGGTGGQHSCGGASVDGGDGGSPGCPSFGLFQPAGSDGVGGTAGSGGTGGQDSRGPITGAGCPVAVCCGLADFTVPTSFSGPRPGGAGARGSSGRAGESCAEPLGQFVAGDWTGDGSTAGRDGAPGGGGGGGGAGGGTEMIFMDTVCEFADGLGGGGGGGGAAGCGGSGGQPGTSGGPSVALLVVAAGASLPTLRDNQFVTRDGARGGDGGQGGEGGAGGAGANGGSLPRAQRVTPTLAAPFPGAAGGDGGDGGGGGGGGAGCGGSAVGVWITGGGGGGSVDVIRGANDFVLGAAGPAGRGGGGDAPAPAGQQGEQRDVVIR